MFCNHTRLACSHALVCYWFHVLFSQYSIIQFQINIHNHLSTTIFENLSLSRWMHRSRKHTVSYSPSSLLFHLALFFSSHCHCICSSCRRRCRCTLVSIFFTFRLSRLLSGCKLSNSFLLPSPILIFVG